MSFNLLLMKLANKLSENAIIFKEIKSQAASTFRIQGLERNQLPSDFFSTLFTHKLIAPQNLGALYTIYQRSNLHQDAKEEAYKCIEDYNFNNISLECTKILKNMVHEIILQPISTTDIQRLAERVPFERRVPEMQLDHKTSIMKLVDLKIVHAFDINVLFQVFMNNSKILNTIIDPNWNRIKSLYATYLQNMRPIEAQIRPNKIELRPGSPGQQPSPVEHYSPVGPPWGAPYPCPPQTEPIALDCKRNSQPGGYYHTNLGIGGSPPVFHRNITDFPLYQSPPSNLLEPMSPQGIDPSDDSIMVEDNYDIPQRDIAANVYPGECVIINIEKFESPGSRDRIGSNADVENIRATFRQLNFKVSVEENLTSEELTKYMKRRANDTSLYNVGVFVCFLMSHGEEGMISGSDGNHVELDSIINSFKNDKCAALKGKPKVFFVQACRGNTVDAPINDRGLMVDNIATETRNCSAQPQDADLIVCQATTKGKVAVRTDTGSWYIDTVCNVIRKTFHFEDLNGMHTKINNQISKKGQDGASTLQVSNVNGSLRKKLRFFPNILANEFLRKNPVDLSHKLFAVQ